MTMMRYLAALLAASPAIAGAQTMLVLHEGQAGPICYRADPGAPFLVSLPAIAGSGLVWAMRNGDGLEQVGETVIGLPAGGGMVTGGPQIQTLRFRSTAPGRHTLTLGYARSGHAGAPIRTLRFCLTTPAR